MSVDRVHAAGLYPRASAWQGGPWRLVHRDLPIRWPLPPPGYSGEPDRGPAEATDPAGEGRALASPAHRDRLAGPTHGRRPPCPARSPPPDRCRRHGHRCAWPPRHQPLCPARAHLTLLARRPRRGHRDLRPAPPPAAAHPVPQAPQQMQLRQATHLSHEGPGHGRPARAGVSADCCQPCRAAGSPRRERQPTPSTSRSNYASPPRSG